MVCHPSKELLEKVLKNRVNKNIICASKFDLGINVLTVFLRIGRQILKPLMEAHISISNKQFQIGGKRYI